VADIKHSESVYRGYLLLLFAVTLFSSIEVGSQHLLKEMGISPLDVSLLRFGIGGIFLFIAALIQVGRKRFLEIIRADGLKLGLLGLLGATAVPLCFHRSLMLTSSMIGGAIFSINPAVIALIFIIFRVDKPTISRIIGIILGIACVVVSNLGAQAHASDFPRYFVGNMFMVGSVLAWSFYFFLVRGYIKKHSGLVVSCIMIMGGTIGLLLFAPFSARLGWGQSLAFFSLLTPAGWALALYLGIVTVGLGYSLMYIGLSKTGVSNGMMIFFVKPALVALLAYFLQGQPLSMWIGIGIMLAISSILVVGIASRTG